MKLSGNVKSVDWLQQNAESAVRTLGERGEPLIITQDGEARAVVQDVAEYERTQQTLAMLRILTLEDRRIEEGQFLPLDAAFERIEKHIAELR